MADYATKEDLSAVLGRTRQEIIIQGQALTLAPLVLTQIADTLLVLDRMRERGVVTTDGKAAVDFHRMLLRGGRDVIELLHIATGQDVAWLGALDGVEAAQLATGVWKVNEDFFDQNRELLESLAVPAINRAKAWAIKLTGQLLSIVLSGVGTGSPTSAATPLGSAETLSPPPSVTTAATAATG